MYYLTSIFRCASGAALQFAAREVILQVGGTVVPRLAGQYVVTSWQWH